MKYQYISYDVWGNEKEGFWVNAAYTTNDYVEIPDGASNDDIRKILKREGWVKKGVRNDRVGIEGEEGYSLYITDLKRGHPEFELRPVKG